jgi:hypothetical protein
MDLFQSLTDHTLIIILAIGGGVTATLGSVLGQREAVSPKLARIILWSGYAVSFISVGLFIIAGFLEGR